MTWRRRSVRSVVSRLANAASANMSEAASVVKATATKFTRDPMAKGKAAKQYEKAKKSSKPGDGARFRALTRVMEENGKSKESAQKIAASIGRKKYGAKKMAAMAAKGRKK